MGQQHLPREEAWRIGEHRISREKKYYLANLPTKTDVRTLAATIKAQWICEQAHQQLAGSVRIVTRSCLRLPPASPACNSKTGKKRSTGKPDPAMLLEAAARLGVPPDRAVIVEDAIAGVEAGKRGGFGLVIGIDRGQNADALRRAGATIVVRDLAELGDVAGEPA